MTIDELKRCWEEGHAIPNEVVDKLLAVADAAFKYQTIEGQLRAGRFVLGGDEAFIALDAALRKLETP